MYLYEFSRSPRIVIPRIRIAKILKIDNVEHIQQGC